VQAATRELVTQELKETPVPKEIPAHRAIPGQETQAPKAILVQLEIPVQRATLAQLAIRVLKVTLEVRVIPESVTLVCREILEHKATRGREIQARLAIPGLREIPVGRGTQANLVIQERELRETPG